MRMGRFLTALFALSFAGVPAAHAQTLEKQEITLAADTRTAQGMKEVYGGDYHVGCILCAASSRRR